MFNFRDLFKPNPNRKVFFFWKLPLINKLLFFEQCLDMSLTAAAYVYFILANKLSILESLFTCLSTDHWYTHCWFTGSATTGIQSVQLCEAHWRQYSISIWQPDAILGTSSHSKLKKVREWKTLFAQLCREQTCQLLPNYEHWETECFSKSQITGCCHPTVMLLLHYTGCWKVPNCCHAVKTIFLPNLN